MNFYQRAEKLRKQYLPDLKINSKKGDTETKLLMLSQLVGISFYSNVGLHHYKHQLGELPDFFIIQCGSFNDCISYLEHCLNDVLVNLGYNDFSLSNNEAVLQSDAHPNLSKLSISVDFRK